MDEQLFVGRQPILTSREEIFGYELIFRGASPANVKKTDHNALLVKGIRLALNDIGLSKLINDRAGFVEISPDFLKKDFFRLLPPNQITFEISEQIEVNSEFVGIVRMLKEDGFSFCLSDFILSEQTKTKFLPIFPFLASVKIDVFRNTQEMILSKMKLLRPHGAKFIADKVEDRESFSHCRQFNFDLYQGHFFAKPIIIEGKRLSPEKMAIARLVSLIAQEPEVDQIEKNFKAYPTLTINLLKFMNSAAMSLRSRLTSIRQAITMLGNKKLIQWLLLMAYEDPDRKNEVNPLFQTCLSRARTLEYLVRHPLHESAAHCDEAFLVGLLSLIDTLFHRPMAEILEEMNIDHSIQAAILKAEGKNGKLLRALTLHESGAALDAAALLSELGISAEDLYKACEESLRASGASASAA